MERIIPKKLLLVHRVQVEGDSFDVSVPEDKFENFWKVMSSRYLEIDLVIDKKRLWKNQRERYRPMKLTSKSKHKEYEKQLLQEDIKADSRSTSIEFW